MNRDLLSAVTNEEIKSGVFSMNPTKAPGVVGMTPLFFHQFWSLISNDVCRAVRRYFEMRNLLLVWNKTLVTLVPKIKTPTTVQHFRPVSLCSTLYMISTNYS